MEFTLEKMVSEIVDESVENTSVIKKIVNEALFFLVIDWKRTLEEVLMERCHMLIKTGQDYVGCCFTCCIGTPCSMEQLPDKADEVVNLLLENARFAELTYRIAQYFDDTFASGIAAQNAMLTTLSTLLRTKVKTPEAAKAAKDISLRRKPVYQGDLDDIEMYFMAAVKEIKKGIGSHYAEQEAMSKKVAEKMFTELTKGQDVQHPTITAEQLTDAMLDSVSGMEGATPEALEQLRNGLLGILQSAAEQENAHEADE